MYALWIAVYIVQSSKSTGCLFIETSQIAHNTIIQQIACDPPYFQPNISRKFLPPNIGQKRIRLAESQPKKSVSRSLGIKKFGSGVYTRRRAADNNKTDTNKQV